MRSELAESVGKIMSYGDDETAMACSGGPFQIVKLDDRMPWFCFKDDLQLFEDAGAQMVENKRASYELAQRVETVMRQ